MKDWKVWAILIAFVFVGVCSSCTGCSSDSDIPEQKPTTYTRTCRSCGKTFEAHRENVWVCSDKCYRAFEKQKATFRKYGY